MKNLVALACLLISLFPTALHAEELNAGFVKGLWYSSPNVFANEPTRIYVALRNHTDRDLTGTVRFSANGKRIGIAYVSALPGRIVEAWTDWTPHYGTTTITATLTEVRFHELGENPETAEVVSMLAEEKLFIDYDTDRDGIGNKNDSDDDGDTVTDETEITNGTDPLVAEKPKETPITSNQNSRDDETESGNSGTETESPAPTSRSTSREGLERYIPPGRIDSLVTDVTNRINSTRDSLDTYRDSRPPVEIPFFSEEEPEVSKTPTDTTLTSEPTATITRSIERDTASLVTKILTTLKNIVGGFYALGLWLLATLLAHPAIVQILLLLLIILTIYKLARRVGRRPND